MVDFVVEHSQLDVLQLVAHAARENGTFDNWQILKAAGDDFWEYYSPPGHEMREAGIKIHLSASLQSAPEVLASSIRVLAPKRIAFKHTASLRCLAFLSGGGGGFSQIGKFITVYPHDDEYAHALAVKLHEATKHLQGPRISSEQSFAPDSLVHYRYGGFHTRWLQLRTGQIVPARLGVDGLQPDDRTGGEEAREKANAAFLGDPHRPVPAEESADAPVVRGEYVRIQCLYRGPKGSTWLGFRKDEAEGALVVIKDADAYVMESNDGLDARARLKREADTLQRLVSSGVTPRFLDYWEESQRSVLVYELVEGLTLSSLIASLAEEGTRPPPHLLRAWMLSLCAALSTLHNLGEVFGDLKPANLIYRGGQFHFIDFELTGPPTGEATGSMGTPGYASAQQFDSRSGRTFQDDIYALGATMLAAATLTDASLLPNLALVAEIERQQNHESPVYSVIRKCVSLDPRDRFRTVGEILEFLGDASVTPTVKSPDADKGPLDYARDIGDAVVRDATISGDEAFWISDHPNVLGQAARDLYCGSSGTALFLCALFEATSDRRYLDVALKCANWLSNHEPVVPRQAPMHGLYFGESGCGFLYLKIYELTRNTRWLDLAFEISRAAATAPQDCADLMTGVAGIGLLHLSLWRVAGDQGARQRAFDSACALQTMRSGDLPIWAMPENYGSLSGKEYLGFAHGIAGIGYFFAQCCIAGAEVDIKRQCMEIADYLLSEARSALADGSGLAWPLSRHARSTHAGHWCHGSAGIARFFLNAYSATSNKDYLEAAERACRSLISGPQWLGTTQCHGLASNLEVLIDLWQQVRRNDVLSAAGRIGANLAAYRTERGWPSEYPGVVTHDFMVGQAGIGAAFLRLHDPNLPHLICPNAFNTQPAGLSEDAPGKLVISTA